MKKINVVLMSLVLLLTLVLTACSQTAKIDNTSSPSAEQSAMPSDNTSEDIQVTDDDVAESVEPSAEIDESFAQMNAYELLFGGSEDEFFSAYDNTNRALDALEPLLFSAVWATMDVEDLFFVEDEPADASFEWTTVYHMINDYEFDKTGVTWENGNIVVSSDAMEDFFLEAFAVFVIPEIPEDLSALISYDAAAGTYTLLSADGGGMTFVLKTIALSLSSSAADGSQSASLQFDIVLNDGTVAGTLAVEIIPSEISSYHYTIQAAYPVEPIALPNPMQESNEQEIMETLGISFDLPEGTEDVKYFIIDAGDEPAMAQAMFMYNGANITYRIQSGAEFADISGVYEEWATTDTAEIGYCSGEIYLSDDGQGVCLWFDTVPGLMYSVYMDTQADAEALAVLANELFVPMQGDA